MARINLEDSRITDPQFVKGVKHGLTALADAAANISRDSGPVIWMTPTASRILTLPVVTPDMKGLTYYFITMAAFTLVVKNQAAATIATVPATIGATGMVVCTGDATTGIGGWIGGM